MNSYTPDKHLHEKSQLPIYLENTPFRIFEVKINGSVREIEFRGSTTGTAHCHPSNDIAEIKSARGWVKAKTGQKIVIEDGCLTIE
ncbi:MAG: hypothetical protein A3D92_19315 [Bacteroidetes bacterium RIFCSPHIGHO2_02_FULL_44_7]|nr:MAG: hypothetical protein A3D92_19315 [Bacteroidetes bacterium RIFCSPHIGHO2_02_FULL_44_7]